MTRKEFESKYHKGDILTMWHYNFKTGKRTKQPTEILGVENLSDDPDEFLINVLFVNLKERFDFTPILFSICSNMENFKE